MQIEEPRHYRIGLHHLGFRPFFLLAGVFAVAAVAVWLWHLGTSALTKLIEFEEPAYPPERRLYFYLNAENRIKRYADLYGRSIYILEVASYVSRFDNDDKLIKEPAPRYENLMLMMQKGRVDVVIAPELVGLYAVEKLGLDVEVSPFFVPGERSYIAVAKNSPVLKYADDIRAALKLIELEGIHEDLVLKYMYRFAE